MFGDMENGLKLVYEMRLWFIIPMLIAGIGFILYTPKIKDKRFPVLDRHLQKFEGML